MKDTEMHIPLSCNTVMSDDVEHGRRVYVLRVEIDGVKFDVQCDTGAPLSPISVKMFNRLFNHHVLRKCAIPFAAYGGFPIKVCGEFSSIICDRGLKKKVTLIVTDTSNPPLLGRNFLRKFDYELVQVTNSVNAVEMYSTAVNKLKSEFSEIFDGKLGAFNLEKIHLSIDKSVKPIFHKPRPVPIAWKSKI